MFPDPYRAAEVGASAEPSSAPCSIVRVADVSLREAAHYNAVSEDPIRNPDSFKSGGMEPQSKARQDSPVCLHQHVEIMGSGQGRPLGILAPAQALPVFNGLDSKVGVGTALLGHGTGLRRTIIMSGIEHDIVA